MNWFQGVIAAIGIATATAPSDELRPYTAAWCVSVAASDSEVEHCDALFPGLYDALTAESEESDLWWDERSPVLDTTPTLVVL